MAEMMDYITPMRFGAGLVESAMDRQLRRRQLDETLAERSQYHEDVMEWRRAQNEIARIKAAEDAKERIEKAEDNANLAKLMTIFSTHMQNETPGVDAVDQQVKVQKNLWKTISELGPNIRMTPSVTKMLMDTGVMSPARAQIAQQAQESRERTALDTLTARKDIAEEANKTAIERERMRNAAMVDVAKLKQRADSLIASNEAMRIVGQAKVDRLRNKLGILRDREKAAAMQYLDPNTPENQKITADLIQEVNAIEDELKQRSELIRPGTRTTIKWDEFIK